MSAHDHTVVPTNEGMDFRAREKFVPRTPQRDYSEHSVYVNTELGVPHVTVVFRNTNTWRTRGRGSREWSINHETARLCIVCRTNDWVAVVNIGYYHVWKQIIPRWRRQHAAVDSSAPRYKSQLAMRIR